jgi:hypothetical protein
MGLRLMKTVYAVRPVAVRDAAGAVAGWVRADLFADGTDPSDLIVLRDGSACGQAEAMARINADRSLLYRTCDDAVRDGLARLRDAHLRGEAVPVGPSTP